MELKLKMAFQLKMTIKTNLIEITNEHKTVNRK